MLKTSFLYNEPFDTATKHGLAPVTWPTDTAAPGRRSVWGSLTPLAVNPPLPVSVQFCLSFYYCLGCFFYFFVFKEYSIARIITTSRLMIPSYHSRGVRVISLGSCTRTVRFSAPQSAPQSAPRSQGNVSLGRTLGHHRSLSLGSRS